jgi:hypothetical protein
VRVALLVLTVFGIPLVLAVSYLAMHSAVPHPPFDRQPGGEITGRVVHANGDAAADVPVAVLLHRPERRPEPYARSATADDGTFAFDVPPLEGCYVVIAGGGPWVEVPREVSLTASEPPDLRFTLRPAAELVLSLERANGAPIRGGTYELVREETKFGLRVPSAVAPGTFEGAVLERGGLEPGVWSLRVELVDGTEIEFAELELGEGRAELGETF